MNQCPFCKNELFSEALSRCPSCGQVIHLPENSDVDSTDSVETFISDEFVSPVPGDVPEEDGETVDDLTIPSAKPTEMSEKSVSDSTEDDETFVADELAERVDEPGEKTVAFDSAEHAALAAALPIEESHQTLEAEPEATLAEIPDDSLGTVEMSDSSSAEESLRAGDSPFEIDEETSDAPEAEATFVLEDDDPANSATVTGEEVDALISAELDADRTVESDDLDSGSHDPDSDDQTMITDDPDDEGVGTASSQTLISDLDANENELKTLQSNWAAKPGEKPEMTIKSNKDIADEDGGDPQQTITTVPQRSMRSINDQRTSQRDLPEYELLSILGEGGMGVVWSARQTSVDRKVAVKMIKGNYSQKPGQRNKFLAEAIVTGDLDHPNIVPIYDVGSDLSGSLFYAMKQVQGTPWLKVIKEKSLHDNLEILLRVADAVAFAHARGIVHRDLKPENVMLGEFGEVLVMDWGLALPMKSFHNAERIRSISSMGGTPAYMSPEMATGPIDRITPQSDVYLLGAMLWEVVTGRPPHPGKKVQQCLLAAMRNTIRETEKTGELIDIANKAMSTNMKDRHAQVRDFQQEVRSYLDHSESLALGAKAHADLKNAEKSGNYNEFSKAIFGFEQARDLWSGNQAADTGISTAKLSYAKTAHQKADYDLALSLLSRDRPEHVELRELILRDQHERDARQGRLKLAKRAMMGMAACFLVVVSTGFVMIRAQKNEALLQKSIAEDEREEAKRQESIADEQRLIAEQKKEEVEASSKKLEVALVDVRKQKDIAEDKTKLAEEKTELAEKSSAEAKRQAMIAAKNEKEALTQKVEADKQRLLAEMQKTEADKQRKIAETEKETADQERIKAESAEKLARQERDKADEQRKLAVAAKEAEEYKSYIARIGLAAAKIDENAFDVAKTLLKECSVDLRNWEWGRLEHLCSQGSRTLLADGPVDAVAVSPDGRFLLSGSWDSRTRIWDLETQDLIRELPQQGLYVHSVAWSPDQKLIATGGSDSSGRIQLWDSESGEQISKFNGHSDAVVSVRFSPRGDWLLTCSYDETARLWDLRNPRRPVESEVLEGHSWWVWDGAFSPDFDPQNRESDNRIVTVSQDGKAIIWKLDQTPQKSPLTQVSLTEDAGSPEVRSLNFLQESIFTGHRGPIYAVAYAPNGQGVATASYDKRVLVWDPAEVPTFNLDHLLINRAPDLKFIEFQGHSAPVQSVTYSRDGKLLVTGGRDNAVKIWSIDTAKTLTTLRNHHSEVRDVDMTPDGRQVVSGGKDRQIIIWNIEDYEEFRVLNGRELVGHDDAVLGAKFSHDGRQILTAGRDRTARLWDATTGQTIRTFEEGHDFLTSKGLFLRDGRVLATAAADNSVRLWNVESGTQLLRIPETSRAAIIASSQDGKWLVTGHETEQQDRHQQTSGTVKQGVLVWDIEKLIAAAERGVESEKLIKEVQPLQLKEHFNRVTAAGFVPNENRLLTCDSHGRSILWNLEGQKVLWNERHHSGRVTAAAFTPDGAFVYLASSDKTVSRVSTSTGQEDLGGILKHPTSVSSLAMSPNGKRLVSVCLLESDLLNPGSTISLWNLETGAIIRQIDSTDFAINDLSFTPTGDHAIAVCTDNSVRPVNFDTLNPQESFGRPILDFQKLGGLVWSASFTVDGKSILTVGGSEAQIWDRVTYREEMSFSPHGVVAAADFSPDGQLIVTGSWDNSAKIWNATTGQAVMKLIGGHSGYVNSVAFSPDQKYVLTGSDDLTAKLWDIVTGHVVQNFTGHTGRVRQAIFSPNGQMILSVSNDKTARLWNLQTGEQIGKPFTEHQWPVLCCAFSPDGTQILTGSEDNQAILWDVESHQKIVVFEGHTAAISAVCFSKNGSRIFTASQDNSAKIWDSSSGREGVEILTLTQQEQELTSISLSPDGRQVVTGSRDGTAVIWLTSSWETPPVVANGAKLPAAAKP